MVKTFLGKSPRWDKFLVDFRAFTKKNILLDLIKSQETQCAFKNYRNPRVRLMVVCLFIQKLCTFIYLINLQLKATPEYISEQPDQVQNYIQYVLEGNATS
jgi:hypothetical protein